MTVVDQLMAWRKFNEWEAAQLPVERTPEQIISDIGTILSWIPEEVRLQDPDPEKIGVRKMMNALAHLHSR